MDTQSTANCCPKCQSPLPPDAPQGLCPKCLFAAVATPTEADQPAGHRPTPPALKEIAAAFPQLEILEFIGQGGMGFVFKARQPKLDRLVALKILPQSLAADPTFAQRFNREAKLLARLNHPGIVAVHDFGVATGRADLPVRPGNEAAQQHRPTNQFYYLLMEFVDGVNLRQAMQAGRFTPDQALAIVPKICEALQFAHNEGILHRDIKPENILLDAKGRVKIADFGIAKLAAAVCDRRNEAEEDLRRSQTVATENLTEAGKTLGSPNYMAPEQLEHPGEVDHRADIYSLGVVFYEMLTGELPQGRFAPPSQKSAADPRVDEVVLRALEKERERRQHSAGEVKTQVETIASNPAQALSGPESVSSETGLAGYLSRWRRIVALLLGINTFTSSLSVKLVNISAIGILGCVSALGVLESLFPIMRVFFAFSAFFAFYGMIGVVAMIEFPAARRRAQCKILGPFSPGSSRCEEAHSEKSEIGNRKSEMNPRFSRTAIVGAAWLTLFFAVVPAFLWHEIETHEPVRLHDPIWIIVVFAFLLPGFTAPFGTTILGWIAVAQIRRSAGRLHGLWLAVFDGLLFPLLALDGLIYMAVGLGLLVAGLGWKRTSPPTIPLSYLLFVSVLLGILLLVDWLIIHAVWRAVNKPAGAAVQPVQKPDRFWRWFAVAMFAMIAIPFLISIVGLLAAIAIPNFIKARAQSQENARRAATQLATNLPAAQDPSFGPVVERIVGVNGATNSFIDFDNGRVGRLPRIADNPDLNDVTGLPLLAKLMARAGWDGGGVADNPMDEVPPEFLEDFATARREALMQSGFTNLHASYRGLCCFETATERVSNEQWEQMAAREIMADLSHVFPFTNGNNMAASSDAPTTWLFKTREGGAGILQITGFTENPRGVKLRYKLVQNAMASTTNYPSDWIWEGSSSTLDRVPPIFLLRPTTMPTNWVPRDMYGDGRYLARGKTVKELITTVWSQKNSALKIVFAADLPVGRYDFIVTAQPQWWDALQAEIDRRFFLVEQIENRDGTDVVVVKNVSLSEPPQLRFLEWDSDWLKHRSDGVHYPDGSIVTNGQELGWLRHADPGNMSDVSGRPNLAKLHPHFLHLWFSHPLFDGSCFTEVTLADENGGNPTDPYSSRVGQMEAASLGNGNTQWLIESMMCGAGTNIPNRVNVRLRYTDGPLEQVQEIAPDFSGSVALYGDSQLGSIGQDAKGDAFLTIGINSQTMKTRQYCVVAVTRDGRELISGGNISAFSDDTIPQVGRFGFNMPLSGVANFRIGTRPIRTMEWTNVVLPSE